jgi:hypothetical protein
MRSMADLRGRTDPSRRVSLTRPGQCVARLAIPLGGLVLIAGSLLPWSLIANGQRVAGSAGTAGQVDIGLGALLIVLGLVIGLEPDINIVLVDAIATALIGLAVVAYEFHHLGRLEGYQVGWGLYVSGVGATGAMSGTAALLMSRNSRMPPHVR